MPPRNPRPRICGYCGCNMVKWHKPGVPVPPNAATVQHIMARWMGGRDVRENRRPCCFACNQLLEAAGDCPALLACARAIADVRWPRAREARHRRIRGLLRGWVPPVHKGRRELLLGSRRAP